MAMLAKAAGRRSRRRPRWRLTGRLRRRVSNSSDKTERQQQREGRHALLPASKRRTEHLDPQRMYIGRDLPT